MKRFVRSMLLLAGLALLPACTATHGVVATKPAVEPGPATQVAPAPPSPTRIATTRTVVVHFDSDSAEIRAGTMQVLYGASVDLRNSRLTAIRVVGHTDASGRRAYNQRLSERRAAAVADQLRKLGLHADTIQVSGAGESPAAAKAKGKSADDRRVEITFESVETVGFALPAPAQLGQADPACLTTAVAGHPAATCPVVSDAAAPEMGTAAPQARLQSADKPAIKRNLLATGTTWLPPPAA